MDGILERNSNDAKPEVLKSGACLLLFITVFTQNSSGCRISWLQVTVGSINSLRPCLYKVFMLSKLIS